MSETLEKEPEQKPEPSKSNGSWWRKAWNNIKSGYGTTSKFLSENRDLVSSGAGIATAFIAPEFAPMAVKATQIGIDANDRIRKLYNGVPDGDLKKPLMSAMPEMTAKTNQYRSPNAISAPGEGDVYGQNTVPVFRKRQNFPDGITVNVAAPNRYVRRRRPKQVRVKRSHPKQARKVVKRKVRRH